MAVQLTYSYELSKGVAGGLYDMSPYEINSYAVVANGGYKFGMLVVDDVATGEHTAKLPASAAEVANKAGITLWRAHECDKEGNIILDSKEGVSVIRYGRVWARVVLAEGEHCAKNGAVYVYVSGDNAGCLTNKAGDGVTQVTGAKFIGAEDGGIAPVELFFT